MAEILLESLDFEEDFHVSDEWLNEIKERCREIYEGKVKLIPGEEGLTRLQVNFRRNAEMTFELILKKYQGGENGES